MCAKPDVDIVDKQLHQTQILYAKLAAEEQSRGPQEEREQKFSVYEEEEHGRYGRPGANQEEEQKDEV